MSGKQIYVKIDRQPLNALDLSVFGYKFPGWPGSGGGNTNNIHIHSPPHPYPYPYPPHPHPYPPPPGQYGPPPGQYGPPPGQYAPPPGPSAPQAPPEMPPQPAEMPAEGPVPPASNPSPFYRRFFPGQQPAPVIPVAIEPESVPAAEVVAKEDEILQETRQTRADVQELFRALRDVINAVHGAG
jgi:hypothetical protein